MKKFEEGNMKKFEENMKEKSSEQGSCGQNSNKLRVLLIPVQEPRNFQHFSYQVCLNEKVGPSIPRVACCIFSKGFLFTSNMGIPSYKGY